MLDTAKTQAHIQIQQKRLEEKILDDVITIYDTEPFGHLITINQQIIVANQDHFFFHEMMAHVPLFTHAHPKTVAVIGNDTGIISEVLKHATIEKASLVTKDMRVLELFAQYFPDLAAIKYDPRVTKEYQEPHAWLEKMDPIDIIILPQINSSLLALLPQIYNRLNAQGTLVLPSPSPLNNPEAANALLDSLNQAGFSELQLFHFPQPSYPSGWRFALLAYKKRQIKRIREKDIFNRIFRTRYYNFDVHKASLVVPEFLIDRQRM